MISNTQINFFCIGAQKSGTSTLFQLLKQHPDVFIPTKKEAHFFDRELIYAKGIEWYLKKFFNNCSNQKIVGTITPSYIFAEQVPDRLKENFNDQLKFIVILRNPIDRAYSQYLMNISNGKEKSEFEEALSKEAKRIIKSEQSYLDYSYVGRGLYSVQLKRYFEKFNPKNFLILTFEKDVIAQPQEMMKKVCEFFSIEEFQFNYIVEKNEFKPKMNFIDKGLKKVHRLAVIIGFSKDSFDKRYNIFSKNEEKPKLKESLRATLLEKYFSDDINELSKLLKIDFKNIWH